MSRSFIGNTANEFSVGSVLSAPLPCGGSGRIEDRTTFEIACDVVAQVSRGLIAPFRLLAQCLHHDVVEITGARAVAARVFRHERSRDAGLWLPQSPLERLGNRSSARVMMMLGGAGASSQITRAISCGARLTRR